MNRSAMTSISRRIAQLESAARKLTPAMSDEEKNRLDAELEEIFRLALADIEANPGPEIVGDDWIDKLNQIGRDGRTPLNSSP